MADRPAVEVRPPPTPVVRVVNPVLRRVLTSRLAHRTPATLAVLQYTGRRSGRRFAVPVGVHDVGTGAVVFTEAPWRHNFAGGREVVVRRGREAWHGRGALVEDPQAVADALGAAMERVGPQGLAMRVARGHRVTRDDLLAVGRGMVALELDRAWATPSGLPGEDPAP